MLKKVNDLKKRLAAGGWRTKPYYLGIIPIDKVTSYKMSISFQIHP